MANQSLYRPIKTLKPVHHKVIDLLLQGKQLSQISRLLGYASDRLYEDFGTPLFQHELALRRSALESQQAQTTHMTQKSIQDALAAQTAKAVEALESLITSSDESIKLRAAQDILDRTGYPRLSASKNSSSTEITIPSDTISLLKETLSLLSESPKGLEPSKPTPLPSENPCSSGGSA